MTQYKVRTPLFKTSENKLYNPGETVDLVGDEEKTALQFKAVVPVPATQTVQAQPSAVSTIKSTPVTSAASNTPAKTSDAK